MRHLRILAVFFAFLSVSLPAHAQHDARISASLSSAFGDGGPAPAVAFAAALPVFSRTRLEVEGTYVRNLDFGRYYTARRTPFAPRSSAFPSYSPATLYRSAATSSLKGPGTRGASDPTSSAARESRTCAGNSSKRVTTERRRSHGHPRRAPLLTAGGGVEFLLGNRLMLAADARYQRLFEKDRFRRIDIPPNVDLVRVGSAIGYRF